MTWERGEVVAATSAALRFHLEKREIQMGKFWDLYEKNVVISGILALALVGATVYLAVTGQVIPDYLGAATATVLGYFFGAGKAKETVQVLRG